MQDRDPNLSPRLRGTGDQRREGPTRADLPSAGAADRTAISPSTEPVTRDGVRDTDVTSPSGRRDIDAPDAAVVASLVQQRKVKRMLRTKAQNEVTRLDVDIDALSHALQVLGVETPEVAA